MTLKEKIKREVEKCPTQGDWRTQLEFSLMILADYANEHCKRLKKIDFWFGKAIVDGERRLCLSLTGYISKDDYLNTTCVYEIPEEYLVLENFAEVFRQEGFDDVKVYEDWDYFMKDYSEQISGTMNLT